MDCWRLVLHGRHPSAYNMAIDEAILTASVNRMVPPTLRLYGWDKPAISLGYFQNIERSRIDMEYCRQAGIEMVRRPTGGRAVLHGHDLTFSAAVDECVIPDEYRSVLGSHIWLMRGIVSGFGKLGIDAEIGPENRTKGSALPSADCFAHVAECDVRDHGGNKIAGAAQVRKSGVLLEQGSIPRTLPEISYGRVFGEEDTENQTCILDGMPRETIEQAMIEGIAESLGISFELWELTAYEAEIAKELVTGKYASAEWTYSRVCVDKSMLNCYTNRARPRGEHDHAKENPRR